MGKNRTYDEQRSAAEKIVDAHIKARVLRGIELLNEKWGPDWVDHVDPSVLSMGNTHMCVLGQLYKDAKPTREQLAKAHVPSEGSYYDAGYWRGIAIIDGPLLESPPASFGFDSDTPWYEDNEWRMLDDAWQAVIGDA